MRLNDIILNCLQIFGLLDPVEIKSDDAICYTKAIARDIEGLESRDEE